MRTKLQSEMPTPSGTDEDRQYASHVEVEQALGTLTDADYAKLMLIAASFCKGRKFSNSVLEPQELLSEAVQKTLLLEKRWSKRVSILRHLDRAMENISGHLAGHRSKVFPLQDGLTLEDDVPSEKYSPHSQESLTETQQTVQDLLKSVFGDDEESAEVFVRRTEGFDVAEILAIKKIDQQQYETIARRIRRKIAIFLNNQKNA
jgi:hypothetical protein